MTAAAVLLAACAALLASRGTGAFGRRLAAVSRPPGAARLAAGVDAAARARRRRRVAVGAVVAVAVATRAGPLATGLAAATTVAAGNARDRWRENATAAAAAAAVPDACRALAAGLMAGSLPADALTVAAGGSPEPLGGLLRAAASAERLGASPAAALARPPVGCEAMRGVAACWEVCVGTGAALGQTIERLATVFADELEARAVVDAELAGVRLSALVMACLPVFGLALGAALGSDPVGFLIGSPGGRLSLALAALLDGTGLWWVRQLGRRAVR